VENERGESALSEVPREEFHFIRETIVPDWSAAVKTTD
jgi:hypothetical protein